MTAKALPLGWFTGLLTILGVVLTFLLLTACGNSDKSATTTVVIPAAATPSTAPLAVNQPKVSKIVTDQGAQVEFNEAVPLNDGIPAFISFVTVG